MSTAILTNRSIPVLDIGPTKNFGEHMLAIRTGLRLEKQEHSKLAFVACHLHFFTQVTKRLGKEEFTRIAGLFLVAEYDTGQEQGQCQQQTCQHRPWRDFSEHTTP
jgi:hypothetical protein